MFLAAQAFQATTALTFPGRLETPQLQHIAGGNATQPSATRAKLCADCAGFFEDFFDKNPSGEMGSC